MSKDKGLVGILTYHFAANYGAVLQCYALKKYIQSIGYPAQVINFVSEKQENNNALYRKNTGIKAFLKNILLLPFHHIRKERYSRFNCFVNTKILDSNSDKISSINLLRDYINDNGFKYIISGSDQVWNPKILDFNKAFFYPFKTLAKKIGYAVSTGSATPNDIKPYKDFILDFSAITVREKSTKNTISSIISCPLFEVCDPVFLIDQQSWFDDIQKVSDSNNYLLCYFIKTKDMDKKLRMAKTIAKELKINVKLLSARISKYNLNNNVISNAGPIEFLSYFAAASYICTDSFHGTSFALIFNKEFTTFEDKNEALDGRKINLLRNIGAIERVQYLDEPLLFKGKVNYKVVNHRIEEIKHRSRAALIDILRTI